MAIKNIVFQEVDYELHYEIANPTNQKTILFLHGWGSNKEVMKSGFEKILKDFKHIYLDMPGFGKSPNNQVLKTQDYKEIVGLFLESIGLKLENITIAGHSFGGKVATLLHPKNLILLSSAGILEEKSPKVKAKIRLAKVMNKLGISILSKLFRSKDVNTMSECMYGTFKNVVDEDFSEVFKTYDGNTLIFWGKNDTATSLESGKKIATLIKNSHFYPFDGDHYFFLKHSKEIEKIIQETIKGELI